MYIRDAAYFNEAQNWLETEGSLSVARGLDWAELGASAGRVGCFLCFCRTQGRCLVAGDRRRQAAGRAGCTR